MTDSQKWSAWAVVATLVFVGVALIGGLPALGALTLFVATRVGWLLVAAAVATAARRRA